MWYNRGDNMKVVILVESDAREFKEMLESIEDRKVFIVNTEWCDESFEYKRLKKAIKKFSRSNDQILLGKVSGRECVIRELGDEFSEMILALSSNENSMYYTGSPTVMFSDIINMFEKEKMPIEINELKLNYI